MAFVAEYLREEIAWSEQVEKHEQRRRDICRRWLQAIRMPERADPEPQDDGEPAPRHLPDALATPEAMKLWEVAQREGWVDRWYQPKPSLPRWKKAIIANVMGEMAGVRNKWQVLEEFWQMRYLRQEYQEAKKNDGFYSFLHELERLGGEKMKQTLAYVKRKR